MKKLLIVLALLTCSFAQAQAPAPAPAQPAAKPQAPPPPASMAEAYERLWRSVERQFVGAAEEMPEDKYSFAPSQGEFKGVRTFAEQARHVAAVNYMIFASMLGEKQPANVNQGNGPAEMKSKAEIVKYLRDSFDLGRRAFAALNDKNAVEAIDGPFGNKTTRVTMATLAVGHAFDHYGQMVVYLRMNGIVPPASRPRQ